MKRFWAAMAVVLLTIFAAVACNDYGNTFQSPNGAFLSFLSPSQTSAGGSDFTLTLNGNGFVKGTVVQWNGKNLATTVTTDSSGTPLGTTVTAIVPAAMVANPGTAAVNTNNPNGTSGGYGGGTNGLSNTLIFIINNPPNPLPTITSVSPTCAAPGSPLAITVTGTNFMNVPTSSDATKTQFSTLNWTLGSTQLQLTPYTATAATITSTQITATIPAGNVNVAGSASITVSNPPSPPVPNVAGSTGSGGGTSTPVTVTVQTSPCPVAAKAPANIDSAATVAEETPAVSLDGRYVAYTAVDDGHAQIFLRDTCEGAATSCQPQTSLLSATSGGNPAAGESHTPSMSSDGRYVAFSSDAADLVANSPAGRQIYLRDTCAGAMDSCKPSTVLISTDSAGALVGAESILPSVSSSGRFVAFLAVTPSHAPNHPSPKATNEKAVGAIPNSGYRQVFVRDTCLGASNCTPKTTRISLQPGDGAETGGNSAGPALSGKAKNVAMTGAKTSTLFTRSVAVDDSVFLAATKEQR